MKDAHTKKAKKPAYQSIEEQALLDLLRTADRLDRAIEHTVRPWGVTATQYNVLRILRGAHPEALTCTAIGDRMITEEPDITRLLSRLKSVKLVKQQRDRHDRRQVLTQISEQGLSLLRAMDSPIEKAPRELLGHLGKSNLEDLVRILGMARQSSDGENPECDGATRPAPAPSDRADLPPGRPE